MSAVLPPPFTSKMLQRRFPLVSNCKRDFFFGAMQAVPEIRSEENDRDCKRQTFKSQGRHMCVL